MSYVLKIIWQLLHISFLNKTILRRCVRFFHVCNFKRLCFFNDKMATLDPVLSFNGGSIARANILNSYGLYPGWKTIKWVRESDYTRIYSADRGTHDKWEKRPHKEGDMPRNEEITLTMTIKLAAIEEIILTVLTPTAICYSPVFFT